MAETNNSALEDAVRLYFENLHRPGEGRFTSIVQASENSRNGLIAFAGPMYDCGGGFPVTRIGLVAPDGGLSMLSNESYGDADPKWSPAGDWLAFLSDRGRGAGNYQLYLAPADRLAEQAPGPVFEHEVVESFSWSQDGKSILLQTAGAGADAAGSAATARIGHREEDVRESWTPKVETGSQDGMWRRAWVWRMDSGDIIPVGESDQNVWEAAWCGENEVAAIVSSNPSEGGWFDTEVAVAPVGEGRFSRLAKPGYQLAQICASPDGKRIAVVQGRFARTVALGTLTLYDRETGMDSAPAIGAEVSSLAWLSDDQLFFAGMQMPETVVGALNLTTGAVYMDWTSSGTAGRKIPAAWPCRDGAFLAPAHAFDRFSHLLRVDRDGNEKVVIDLAHEGSRAVLEKIDPARSIWWCGADGLKIQGFLAMPKGAVRAPLVAFIHGGPTHLFRDSWTFDNPLVACLVSAGYAVLLPNPRGSSGRGLDFASRVIGDWGGKDSEDILAGVDHVIANYNVDPKRLFVTGGSYGGYMSSWLVTQTDRFCAACPVAPLTDMRSFCFTAHHPEFLSIYTGGDPYEVGGAFDDRSPLRHANKATTPTLLIAGGLDKTTPPDQAYQFYRALVMNGAPAELAIYPEEGHAAARFEAQVDQAIRVLSWFKRWEGRHGARSDA